MKLTAKANYGETIYVSHVEGVYTPWEVTLVSILVDEDGTKVRYQARRDRVELEVNEWLVKTKEEVEAEGFEIQE